MLGKSIVETEHGSAKSTEQMLLVQPGFVFEIPSAAFSEIPTLNLSKGRDPYSNEDLNGNYVDFR
jgi:hypothetical protein